MKSGVEDLLMLKEGGITVEEKEETRRSGAIRIQNLRLYVDLKLKGLTGLHSDLSPTSNITSDPTTR